MTHMEPSTGFVVTPDTALSLTSVDLSANSSPDDSLEGSSLFRKVPRGSHLYRFYGQIYAAERARMKGCFVKRKNALE